MIMKTHTVVSRITIRPAKHKENKALTRLFKWWGLKLKNHLGGSSTRQRGIVMLNITAGRMYWMRGAAQALVSLGVDKA